MGEHCEIGQLPRRRGGGYPVRMLRSAVFALLSAAAVAQNVLQVGPGGYAQIRDAIVAALPGDVIEVAAGAYQPFVLDKALTIRALPGAQVAVLPNLFDSTRIRPPVGMLAKFGRIEFRNPWPYFLAASTSVDRGTVWFEDCIFEAPPIYETGALGVFGASVLLRSCVLVGNNWVNSGGGQGNAGLRAENAYVGATDCQFYGSNTGFDLSGDGGEGVRALHSVVHLVACRLQGGSRPYCVGTNPPGPGLRVGGTSTVWLADCSVVGGNDGCAGWAGAIGLVNASTTPVQYARTSIQGGAGTSQGAATSGPVALATLLGAVGAAGALVRGQVWSVDYRTEPNWPVAVVVSDGLERRTDPQVVQPVWLPAGGFGLLAVLVADAQGVATYATSVPASPVLLGAGLWVEAVSGVALPLQAVPAVGGLVW